ncbi:MAG: GH3 auxin-responsive promoter family protein [Bacteroidales bacterium]|nr:GH3 auxin-responsive promoter family protein [Bacteroidales bacterium]MBN2698362.1 GH3 auxin-responsive promoter family protein [Bacteroidales bacterium]
MAPLINSIISWVNIKRLHQIELFKKYPGNVQSEVFSKLIARARDTVWGKIYGYDSIRSVETYQERVPLQTYEDLKPYVERLRNGEQNVLWPSEIKWFAKSSGTTGDKSKFIPVSIEALEECHFRGGKDIIAIYTKMFPDNGIMKGKALTLGGSHQINNFSNQSFYGDLSAVIIENLPFWANFIRTPSADIALIPDFEEKMKKITEVSIRENVTNIAGVPSWNLVLLNHVLDFTGKSNILDVWPNLELFTHGGVSFTPYREQFRKIIPSDRMHYLETYNASEGFFGIQDDLSRNDMLLMLDLGVYYEFIPMEHFQDPSPPVLTIDRVEKDVNYAMVISTNGGLWRYIIGDTVIFTSLYPHRIRISGRTRYFINAFGEEVILDNAEKALLTACEHTGAIISEYTAGPLFSKDDPRGAHEWLIEFDKVPGDLERFADVLDKTLSSLNSDYEAKRFKNITLLKPKITSLEPGTFYRWMQKRGKLGGQNKIPRLSNDRKYLDELISFISK